MDFGNEDATFSLIVNPKYFASQQANLVDE